ncbi:uncharacterized protein LOC111270324 [Varroa jacobsoni]|uniref:uncharacterized protein LOC111270324 n=1 Tax=Varroa jacobsoni TaxID=62625 RepID=UPI000BF3E097|nr:uncharacterized protein LOC111270324 [Varroa jacobsoni]
MEKSKWTCVVLLCTPLVLGFPQTLADNTQQCSLQGFDIEPLTKSIWVVQEQGEKCPNKRDEHCTYLFSICHHNWELFNLCANTNTACVKQGNQTTVLGDTAPTLSSIDDQRFHVVYVANLSNDNTSKTTNTIIEFLCDPKQTIGGTQGAVEKIIVARLTADIPKVANGANFVVRYAGACKQTESKPSRMGPGGQLFSMLLVIGILYFGGGAVYKHVNGARGVELLPHHWFWTNLPNHVVDGCLFVVRIGTCQGRPYYNQNPDYGSTSPAGVSPTGRTYESL